MWLFERVAKNDVKMIKKWFNCKNIAAAVFLD